MKPESAAAGESARRLWAGAGGTSETPEAIAAAAERLGTQLRRGLGRWIGTDGYYTLLERAAAATKEAHPTLNPVSYFRDGAPVTLAAVQAHGAKAVVDGLVALLAALIELLGRIVGDEMARRLVEQAGNPGSRSGSRAESTGETP
jgi:hypothetical protein